MNKRQTAKMAMFLKVLSFLAKISSTTIYSGYKRLKDEVDMLATKVQTISTLSMQQAQNTTGVTSTKELAFTTMVKLIVKAAQKAKAWAKDTGNTTLLYTFDISENMFDRKSHAKSLTQLKLVLKALTDNIDSIDGKIYNLTPAQVTNASNAVSNYENLSSVTGNTRSNKKAATDIINIMMSDANSSLETMDDLIISEYEDNEPEFIAEYRANRKIDDIIVRHTGVQFMVKDIAGNPIEKAIVTIAGSNKTAQTNIGGEARIIGLKKGTYNITFTLSNKTVTQAVVIERKKMTEVNVEL